MNIMVNNESSFPFCKCLCHLRAKSKNTTETILTFVIDKQLGGDGTSWVESNDSFNRHISYMLNCPLIDEGGSQVTAIFIKLHDTLMTGCVK